EKCKRTCSNSLIDFHDLRLDRQIPEHDLIDPLLDFLDLSIREGRKVCVVESQPIRRDQGPRLLYVRPESIAQDSMQDVRSRMVSRDAAATIFIHLGLYFVISAQFSELDFNLVNNHSARWSISVQYSRRSVRRGEHSGVTHLASGLRIKRRLIEDDLG